MFKNKKIILDLIRRRDEVLKRAEMIVSGKIPDNLILHGGMPDFFMWVIEPHVFEKFDDYVEKSSKQIREEMANKLKEIRSVENEKKENDKTES